VRARGGIIGVPEQGGEHEHESPALHMDSLRGRPRQPMTALRRRVVVRGRVQGVWFRAAVRERARELGVAGWVANRGDGAVEAVFEGREEAVERLVRFCRSGRVETVEVAEAPPVGAHGFEIR